MPGGEEGAVTITLTALPVVALETRDAVGSKCRPSSSALRSSPSVTSFVGRGLFVHFVPGGAFIWLRSGPQQGHSCTNRAHAQPAGRVIHRHYSGPILYFGNCVSSCNIVLLLPSLAFPHSIFRDPKQFLYMLYQFLSDTNKINWMQA